jgi:hypothetical protein
MRKRHGEIVEEERWGALVEIERRRNGGGGRDAGIEERGKEWMRK